MTTPEQSFEYPLQIKEHHLDTFSHVNNATYLEIMEEARWQFITERGYGIDKVRSSGLGPVILEVTLKFQRELTNRENIVIKTRCLDYNEKLGRLEQLIVKSDGQIACTALFVFGLFDTRARKLVYPTEDWLKAIGLR